MPKREPPSRRVLKSGILWLARWLLGNGTFYPGKIRVEIAAAREGETVVVVPVRGIDGLTEPESFGTQSADGVARSELLRVLFSVEERKILSVLAGGPVKAKTVQERSGVEHSKFYPLWSNLQHRGLVGDAEDKEGFVLAVDWVREVLGLEARPAA